jgi:hypothetical protein
VFVRFPVVGIAASPTADSAPNSGTAAAEATVETQRRPEGGPAYCKQEPSVLAELAFMAEPQRIVLLPNPYALLFVFPLDPGEVALQLVG